MLDTQPIGGAERPSTRPLRHPLRRDPVALLSLAVFGAILSLTLLAPLLAPFSPTELDSGALLQPPSRAHWFGTDDLGRDLFSRILWGGRESLGVGSLGVALALVGGLGVGLVAGYLGGWVESVLMRAMDVLLAFPPIFLFLSAVAILGPGISTLLLALGLVAIPSHARLVRSAVLMRSRAPYILAAQAIGASPARIMMRHILPGLTGILVVYSAAGLGSAITIISSLSFLGLGAQPPSPEWGAMLSAGTPFLRQAWWLSTFPGLALFLTVLSVNLLADRLRATLTLRP